jgi:Tetracyclin repressor-like, C-terminal domain
MKRAVFDPISERDRAAHPDASLFRGGDFVADALAGNLALELRKRQQHVEGEPSHAGGGVESLGHRDERDVVFVVTIIDAAGDFMESRPTLPAVWGAMRGAPELRALDLADTEGNAQILAPAIGALLPRAPAEDVEALALVTIEGVWSALQLGCELPPEKRPRVRAMLKEFVAAAIAGLMEKYR